MINWADGAAVRPLDYEQDILFRLPWERIRPDAEFVERIKKTKATPDTRMVRIDLKDTPAGKDFIETADVMIRPFSENFDPVYAVRAVSDIIPNPG